MPIPKEQVAEIFEQLVVVDNHQLKWRDGIKPSYKFDDNRCLPPTYILLTALNSLEDYDDAHFRVSHLTRINESNFIAGEGEDTGIKGILGVAQLFPLYFEEPNQVLLVGAFNSNAISSTLAWINYRNWSMTTLTVVDDSNIPLETTRLMSERGFMGSRVPKLVHSDVRTFKPDYKYGMVIGDGLNTCMVKGFDNPAIYKKSPYRIFEEYLGTVAGLLDDDGVFLSRCILRKENPLAISNYPAAARPTNERMATVLSRIGKLSKQVNKRILQEVLEGTPFYLSSSESFCGVEQRDKRFQAVTPRVGRHAEIVFERLHRRYFKDVDMIRIEDTKFGFVHLNFACSEPVIAG